MITLYTSITKYHKCWPFFSGGGGGKRDSRIILEVSADFQGGMPGDLWNYSKKFHKTADIFLFMSVQTVRYNWESAKPVM